MQITWQKNAQNVDFERKIFKFSGTQKSFSAAVKKKMVIFLGQNGLLPKKGEKTFSGNS